MKALHVIKATWIIVNAFPHKSINNVTIIFEDITCISKWYDAIQVITKVSLRHDT